MRRMIFLALFAGVSCTHDLGGPLELETEKGNLDAHLSLQSADFESAREKYAAVLEASPRNAEAAFGYAISDLLTLPSWKPVADVLERCNQPTFNIAREVFGPNGVLAREAQAASGTAEVAIHFFPSSGAGGARIDFAPTSVKSEIHLERRNEGDVRVLDIQLYDARSQDGAVLTLSFNPDDLTKNDGTTVVEFAPHISVPLEQLDGTLSVFDPARLQDASTWNFSTVPLSGALSVEEAGRRPGEKLRIKLENVVLPATCLDGACTAVYGISGTIEDSLSENVDFDPATIPFGTAEGDLGPPRRNALVVALEQCSPIDTGFIAARVRDLGDQLAANAEKLELVAATDPSFTFEIPRELLHAQRDLLLNVTDAKILLAFVQLAAASAELLGQWNYAEGTLQDLVQNFTIWEDPLGLIEPEQVEIRDFEPAAVADNLARTLLTRAPELELGMMKLRLDHGLAAFNKALEDPAPPSAGIFDFSVPATRRLFLELSSGIGALRSSLDASSPVEWPEARLFRFHLRQIIDQPLDRDRILAATRLSALVRLEPGDEFAPLAADRNDRLIWEPEMFTSHVSAMFDGRGEDPAVIEAWLGGAIDLPADLRDRSCSKNSDCGDGYTCAGERCEYDLPWVFTPSAWDQASRDQWPVFINPGVRDAFGL